MFGEEAGGSCGGRTQCPFWAWWQLALEREVLPAWWPFGTHPFLPLPHYELCLLL